MSTQVGSTFGEVERTFLIVDDRRLVRETLERLVRNEWSDAKIVGFDTANEAVAFMRNQRADIVVFDAGDRTMPSAEAIRSIRTSRWGTRVLLLQFEGTVEEEIAWFWAGVSACVPKGATGAGIVEIFRLVTTGGAYVSAEVVTRLVRSREAVISNSTSTKSFLSPREYTLLESLKLGSSNKEIARSLQISESAVKLYLRNLFHKLRVKNRTEAVITGIKMGIFERDEAEGPRKIRHGLLPKKDETAPPRNLDKRR